MHLSLASYFLIVCFTVSVRGQFNDICGLNNDKRFYVEHGEFGSLVANYQNNIWHERNKNTSGNNKCTVEFITCPSCVINIKFRFLNISRNCGKGSVFDTCGCDYIWIYEPPIEDASGEQFCGRFIQNNVTELTYVSQTRIVAVTFIYSNEYGHAFTLDYSIKRNRVHHIGSPRIGNMNNASQYIASPFFPHLYPIDLSVEYVISCDSAIPCRISLIFTDFLIADSSILEFFDWNGQRMYVTSGNVFRPPTIISTGPSLVVRFYANGASNLGFKASYSYILGNLNDVTFSPNIGCGGFVNNLGGAITMMNMVERGIKFFDCVWIVRPPEVLQHRKTHLYVKVVNFSDFGTYLDLAEAGTTEIVIRQGITSNQPAVEMLKNPMAHFSLSKQIEHVVPIKQGFYIRLRGHFGPLSQLAIVFAAFNYKECFTGSDFLCQNMRCISILLNCDGFDHCGDASDETSDCSLDPKDHREYSKIPNFLFPKMEPYSDIATATFVFLTCSFGLIAIILAMALLLHRVNVRARQQRQIQDHLETIHAILEEGVGDIEEEIIIPDEPPDYEAPPEYEDILKLKYTKKGISTQVKIKSSHIISDKDLESLQQAGCKSQSNLSSGDSVQSLASTSKNCILATVKIPDSPPPAYENLQTRNCGREILNASCNSLQLDTECQLPGPSSVSFELSDPNPRVLFNSSNLEENATKYLETVPKYPTQIFSEIKKSLRYCKSVTFIKQSRKTFSFSEENLVRYFSDSKLMFHSDDEADCSAKVRISQLKKSFSTDDISLL